MIGYKKTFKVGDLVVADRRAQKGRVFSKMGGEYGVRFGEDDKETHWFNPANLELTHEVQHDDAILKKAMRQTEEQAQRDATEQARRGAEEQARREAEEQVRKKAQEQAQRDAEEQARKKSEEQARKEAEEQARREAEEQAKKEAEEQAKKEAEEQGQREAEEQMKKREEEQAKKGRVRKGEESPKKEASRNLKNGSNANAKNEASRQVKKKAAAEKARKEAEEQTQRDAEERAKEEAAAIDRQKAVEKAMREVEHIADLPVRQDTEGFFRNVRDYLRRRGPAGAGLLASELKGPKHRRSNIVKNTSRSNSSREQRRNARTPPLSPEGHASKSKAKSFGKIRPTPPPATPVAPPGYALLELQRYLQSTFQDDQGTSEGGAGARAGASASAGASAGASARGGVEGAVISLSDVDASVQRLVALDRVWWQAEGEEKLGRAFSVQHLAQKVIVTADLSEPFDDAPVTRMVGLAGAGMLREQRLAVCVCRQLVRMRRRRKGREHVDTAAALNNLAGLLVSCGCRSSSSSDSSSDSNNNNNKNNSSSSGSSSDSSSSGVSTEWQEAEALYRESLSIKESHPEIGPFHAKTAVALSNLAALMVKSRRLPEAEPLYRRALEISIQAMGGDASAKSSASIIGSNLGNLLLEQGRRDSIGELAARFQALPGAAAVSLELCNMMAKFDGQAQQ